MWKKKVSILLVISANYVLIKIIKFKQLIVRALVSLKQNY